MALTMSRWCLLHLTHLFIVSLTIIIILDGNGTKVMATTISNVTYPIGVLVAINANLQTDYINARYVAHMNQALRDIQSGFILLDPPLPPGIRIFTHLHAILTLQP
jgi:hypothetical protein